MKAKVDLELCIGCNLCAETCAEVFRMEGEKAIVCVDTVPKESEESCKKATEDCPVDAIVIEEVGNC
jgi:ferredoxin